jgi:hypothetical protein
VSRGPGEELLQLRVLLGGAACFHLEDVVHVDHLDVYILPEILFFYLGAVGRWARMKWGSFLTSKYSRMGWRDVQDLLGFGFASGFAVACS